MEEFIKLSRDRAKEKRGDVASNHYPIIFILEHHTRVPRIRNTHTAEALMKSRNLCDLDHQLL